MISHVLYGNPHLCPFMWCQCNGFFFFFFYQTIVALERKRYNQHIAQLSDQELRAVRRYEAIQLRLQERLKVCKAEKIVAESMSLTQAPNYQLALQEKPITRYREFQKNVARTLQEMDPVYRREVEAKGLLTQARKDVRNSLAKNVGIIKTICAWRPLKPGTFDVVAKDRFVPAGEDFHFKKTGFPTRLGKSSVTVLPAITKRLTMDVMDKMEQHNKSPPEIVTPAIVESLRIEEVDEESMPKTPPTIRVDGPLAPVVLPKPTHPKTTPRGFIAKPHVAGRENSTVLKAPESQSPEWGEWPARDGTIHGSSANHQAISWGQYSDVTRTPSRLKSSATQWFVQNKKNKTNVSKSLYFSPLVAIIHWQPVYVEE